MTSLVACLGPEQRTWEYMQKLIESEAWESVFLFSSSPEANSFKCSKEVKIMQVDSKLPLQQLTEQIRKALEGKILDTEAAVNFALGSGKEHMAILAALLKLGLGIRLVAYTNEGVKEI